MADRVYSWIDLFATLLTRLYSSQCICSSVPWLRQSIASLAGPDPLPNAKRGRGLVKWGVVRCTGPTNSWGNCGVNQDTKITTKRELEPFHLLLCSHSSLLSLRMKLKRNWEWPWMKYWRSIETVTCVGFVIWHFWRCLTSPEDRRIGIFFSSLPDQKINHFCISSNSPQLNGAS